MQCVPIVQKLEWHAIKSQNLVKRPSEMILLMVCVACYAVGCHPMGGDQTKDAVKYIRQ